MTVRGWCPGSLRPMPAGDGLLVRIRPHGGRLTRQQVASISALAIEFGNGQIDLGSRANLQLRGIKEQGLPVLQQSLREADLLDADSKTEARRNILLNPFSARESKGFTLLRDLEEGLRYGPDLPAKFGFAIDIGPIPALQEASADLRIEQTADGLMLRADGMEKGELVPADYVVARALEIAVWFSRQTGAKRMRDLVAAGHLPPLRAEIKPPKSLSQAELLRRAPFLFAAFGATTAQALAALEAGLRLTPWRAVLPETAPAQILGEWLTYPKAPLLRVSACTGSPGCAAASVETRALARLLADLIPESMHLHISGCAKGCAFPRPSHLTLVGREGRFDLIHHGKASDPASRHGLNVTEVMDYFRGLHASHL